VIDPATETTIGRVPAGAAADANRAVEAARLALDEWSLMEPRTRAEFLRRIAAGLEERSNELCELITRDLGCPLETTRWLQVEHAAEELRGMADLAENGPWRESIDNGVVCREPFGVAVAITPWNYPLDQIVGKLAPALAAGCTLVIKPSEVAPLCAFVLAEVVDEAGLPPGVVNLVTGYGPVVGEALADHPHVDKISFTGSTTAGQRVAALAARAVKSVTLELGGKSANVILADADLDAAVEDGLKRCFLNSGQTCNATTRMLVPRTHLEETERMAARAAADYITGDPFNPETRLGPLVSRSQLERVRGYIESGITQGARLIVGGVEPPDGAERGYFLRPTVFSDVRPSMTIAQEEIFGPVLSIIPYDDEVRALEIANGTMYGLCARIWSSDSARVDYFTRRLRAGQVYVNDAEFQADAPFGGYKQSGIGREKGKYGLGEYLQTKAIIYR
jgi:acyl-CoA reductase-like NAD-dependent aldehyde dehydrogenase